ncbi:MAG: sulfurtransferase [Acidobacteria bacterium]|nr:MAG: sulfurtransferase [Acidobacteriota bacterium]
MKLRFALVFAVMMFAAFAVSAQKPKDIPNPAIDMKAFLKVAGEAAEHRETHRVTEEEFIRMSKEAGVAVLDARSRQKFDELHIRGAVNLSFPDITFESLAIMFPDKNQKILIYCNNNFTNAEKAFPAKAISASLNLSTYVSLYTYGYRNVYELGPLLDAKTTKLTLVPTETVVAEVR